MWEETFRGKRFLIPAAVYPPPGERRPACNVLSVPALTFTSVLALLISPSEWIKARTRGLLGHLDCSMPPENRVLKRPRGKGARGPHTAGSERTGRGLGPVSIPWNHG